jgi:hypothetical protein
MRGPCVCHEEKGSLSCRLVEWFIVWKRSYVRFVRIPLFVTAIVRSRRCAPAATIGDATWQRSGPSSVDGASPAMRTARRILATNTASARGRILGGHVVRCDITLGAHQIECPARKAST